MDLNSAQAESGPTTGNAGASDVEKDPLSAALSSAIDSAEPSSTTETAQPAGNDEGNQQAEQAEPVADAKPEAKSTEAAPEGQAEPLDAPQHWPADRREAFKSLPDEARKLTLSFVKDLQGGFTRKMQEVGDKVRFSDTVGSLFNEGHIQRMQRDGVDAVGAIRNLMALDDYAARDPVGYLKWAMQRLQVDPSQIVPPQQQAPDPAADLENLLIDPNVKSLKEQLEQFKQRFETQDRQAKEQQQAQLHQHVSALKGAVAQFRTTLDDTGNLRYPHFDTVQEAMGALMETHHKLKKMPDSYEKMDLAYQMAVTADPDLGKEVIEKQVLSRVEKEQKKLEAQRAKMVGGIRPASGAPAVRPNAASLDDALSSALSGFG